MLDVRSLKAAGAFSVAQPFRAAPDRRFAGLKAPLRQPPTFGWVWYGMCLGRLVPVPISMTDKEAMP
jgi:hypothetical protein